MVPQRGQELCWAAIGSSVRGASHVREDLPNQDALLLAVPGDAGPLAFAAVADGHGGARHFRSADGSRMAVAAARELMLDSATALAAAPPSQRAQLVAVDLPVRIVGRWVELAREHLAAHPITSDEWARLGASEGDESVALVRADPLLAYGATLLAALALPGSLVLCQLGDGDVLLVAADGATTRPVPRDERLAGNFTTSLCRAGAEGDFRCVALDGAAARPALVLLSTDGYANSFRTDADYLKVGSDFLALLRNHGTASVSKQLPGILEHASKHGSGDDITLALMVGELATDAALAPVLPQPDTADTATPALEAARQQIARQRAWIIALSLALLVSLLWTQREHLASVWARGGHGLPREASGKPLGPLPTLVPAAEGRDTGLAVPAAAASQPAIGQASLEAVRAAPVQGGIEVHARIQPTATADLCTVRATVHDAAGHELARQSTQLKAGKPLDKGAALGGIKEDSAELPGQPVMLLVATPKDAAKAKAMRVAAHPQFAVQLECGAQPPVHSGLLPVLE